MFGKNDKPLREVEVDLRQKQATHELNEVGQIVGADGRKASSGGSGFSDTMNFNKRIAALEMGESAKSLVLSEVNRKITALHGFQKSVLMFCKDLDTRLDIMLELLIVKGVCTKEDFESIHDDKRGIRLKSEDEKIVKDDIVWVDYVATIKDHPIPLSENEIPVRVGLGAVAFEETLIGKKPYTAGVSFTKKFEDKNYPDFFGKTVNFRINIGKVKTHKPEQPTETKNGSPRTEAGASNQVNS